MAGWSDTHYTDPSRDDAVANAKAALDAGPDFVEAWVQDEDGRRVFTCGLSTE
jgi:hypothetical protein